MDRVSSERTEETTRLGPYEIIRKLARGGMAELFLARAPDGVVVVKKILPRYAESSRMVQLFLDEARLAGGLHHPNIVRTFGAGEDRGTAFFAMEYLHGQDVRMMLHRSWTVGEQVPMEHAVHIASQVAAALHHAHEQRGPDGALLGIVHRDVSPSNIAVSYDGAVKLLDFGVAKAATSSVRTRTGSLKGKISYMSPEQARGATIDRRSDIFSLGIVLWEMVTTQRLFRGENDLQTLQLIINEPPRRPSELRPDCSPELERVILRALSQDLGARYRTAAELGQDLEAVARAEGLASGAVPLAEYIGRLFAPEVRSWHEARAAGVTLAQHLTSGGELTIQLTESDFIEAFDLDKMLAEEEAEAEEFSVQTDIPTRPMPPLAAGGWDGPPTALIRGSRASTPPSPLPVARASAPTPPPLPQLPPPQIDAAGDELARAGSQSGPWAIARGSSVATPSSGLEAAPGLQRPATAPVAPGPGGVALDPALADRLLRRGVWVVAALVGVVVIFAIIMAIAVS